MNKQTTSQLLTRGVAEVLPSTQTLIELLDQKKIKVYMGYKNRKSENFITRTADETSQNFNWGLSFRPLKKVRAFYYASNTSSDDAAGQKKFESLSNNIGISYGTRLTNLLSSDFVLLRTETENRNFFNNNRNERDELSFDVRLNYLFNIKISFNGSWMG